MRQKMREAGTEGRREEGREGGRKEGGACKNTKYKREASEGKR